MPTLQDALRFTHMNFKDKTSGKRLREIVSILKKHGVRSGLTPQKAVAVLQDLGPTFVKFGQIMSAHPDMLPQEYCDAFSSLRADVEPMDFETVCQQFEQEFHIAPQKAFEQFDPKPLGSASIAQVHRAVLKNTALPVAVKIQRPGVVERVAEDLTLMRHMLVTYEFFDPGENQISFAQFLDELERSSKDELDFTVEAANLKRFALNNAKRSGICAPRVYEEYSTKTVITMDFVGGLCLDCPEELAQLARDERDATARFIARNYLDQVMTDGFFHADPHAGNIFIGTKTLDLQSSQSENSIHDVEWIDFGIMGTLNTFERACLTEIMIAMVRQDAYALKKALLKLAQSSGAIDHAALLTQCDALITQYASADLDSFDTAGLLQELVVSMGASGYRFPPGVMMLARGLVILEGTIHLLSGSISVNSVITDFLETGVNFERLENKIRELSSQSIDSAVAMTALPARAAETLDMLRKGQLSLKTTMSTDKAFRAELTTSLEHFSGAVIAAALFIGSCILCLTQMQPQVLGVPLFGLGGFVSGFIIAFYIFYDMWRERHYRK